MNKTELKQYDREFSCILVIRDNLVDGMYRAIMTKARDDKNFEKMVQSATVDKVITKSGLDKHKIKF